MVTAEHALANELSVEDIETISKFGVSKTYPRNTLLISEQDHSDALFFVIDGKVKIFVSDENGKEVILNILGAGEYFGEISLIDEAPRSASAMTMKPSRILSVPRRGFERCLMERPEISVKLMRLLTGRLRALTDVAKNLALQDVYGRLRGTLQKLARETSEGLVIEQRLTHQDLANMVGASREMVSRIMKDLSNGGYVETDSKSITIRRKLPPAW